VPGRHSLTVQLNPYGIGHAAVTLTDPSGQTYAGFGPRMHGTPVGPGKFDVHTVPSDTMSLPPDYSNVLGDDHRTYSLPITEEQARAAHAEIDRISHEQPWYNAMKADPRVCTTIADRIMRAAGVDAGLYVLPGLNDEYLSDVARTLAQDPKAKVLSQHRLPVPDSLRGLQPDYAFIGGGYDTPVERARRSPSGDRSDATARPDQSPPFAERFGDWAASPTGSSPMPDARDGPAGDVPGGASRADIRRLTRKPAL
jgi:hypothetical protein